MTEEHDHQVKNPSLARVLANDPAAQITVFGILLPIVFVVFLVFNPPQANPMWVYLTVAVPILAVSALALAWRYLLISRIVQDGIEVKAKVLSAKKTTNNQGVAVVRTELRYEFAKQMYETRKGFVMEELQTGDDVILVVDPKKPQRFVLRSDYYWKPDEPSKTIEHVPRIELPAEESSLWPEGKLLQIEAICERLTQKDSTVLILTNNRLTLGQRPMPSGDDIVCYPFHEDQLAGERTYEAMRISRIAMAPSFLREPLSIWVRDDSGHEERIVKASMIGLPRTIVNVTKEGIRQAAIPSNGRQWTPERVNTVCLQLLVKEMERQFRSAAPQAEIEVKGDQMDDGVFRKLVK